MLVTSSTDACAFYANCISNITVIRIVGAFVGTMVLVSFVLVITYFPAVVVIWNRMGWEDTKWSCRVRNGCGHRPKVGGAEESPGEGGNVADGSDEEQRECLQVFCNDRFAPAFFSTRTRSAVVLAASLLLVGIFAGISSQLKVSEKDFRAQSFPYDSMTMRFFDTAGRFRNAQQNLASLAFVVGVGSDGTRAVGRSQIDPNSPEASHGFPTFRNVDFSSSDAQAVPLGCLQCMAGKSSRAVWAVQC